VSGYQAKGGFQNQKVKKPTPQNRPWGGRDRVFGTKTRRGVQKGGGQDFYTTQGQSLRGEDKVGSEKKNT